MASSQNRLALRAEQLLAVHLPKSVRVENLRLGLLLWAFRALAIVWIMWICWDAQAWNVQSTPHGGTAFWAQVSSQEKYAEGQRTTRESSLCDPTKNSQFDYQYDKAAIFKYTNVTCTDLGDGEYFVKGENQLFIPTFFEESIVERRATPPIPESTCAYSCVIQGACASGAPYSVNELKNELGECICECKAKRNRFVTGVESLLVSFTHSVSETDPKTFKSAQYFSSSKEDNLKTVIQSAEGEVLRTFQPGESVNLNVQDYLELAGIGSLEERVSETNENQIPDNERRSGTETYPALRMTGLVLEVQQSYHNKLDKAHGDPDHSGPICYVTFTPKTGLWSSRPQTDFAEPMDVERGVGKYRYRYTYGIRLYFTPGGTFSYFDPMGVFWLIASVYVYLQMPSFIVSMIARNGLGALSKIYRKATVQLVTFRELFKGLISRALAAQFSYESFVLKHHGNNASELSSGTLDKGLASIFKNQARQSDLEEAELRMLRRLMQGHLDTDPETPGSNSEKQKGYLSAPDFVTAATNTDPVSLQDLEDIFDMSRKRGCLERLFDSNFEARKSLSRSKTSRINPSASNLSKSAS